MSIAKDQAKRATGGNNGNTPAANQPPGIQPPTQPPVDPTLAATIKNIADLRADFAVISTAANVAAASDQRIPLLNHLSAAAQGTKASSANVRKLASNLINALAGCKKFEAADQKLPRTIHALFNGSRISAEQQDMLLAEAKKILTDAGADADATGKVMEDLKAIATETK